MRCLGTLEFLCDFYDRCHCTQRKLKLELTGKDTVEILGTPKTTRTRKNSNVDSDKENALPPVNVIKRKPRSPKNCITVSEHGNAPPKNEKTEKARDEDFAYKVERGDKTTSVLSMLPTFPNVHEHNEQSARKKSLLKTELPSIIGASFEENSSSVNLPKDKKSFEYRRGRGRRRGRGKGRKFIETRITKSEKSYFERMDSKRGNIFDGSSDLEEKRLPCTLDIGKDAKIISLKATDEQLQVKEYAVLEKSKFEYSTIEPKHAEDTKLVNIDTSSYTLHSLSSKEEKHLLITNSHEDIGTSSTLGANITVIEIDGSIAKSSINLENETSSKSDKPVLEIVKQERLEDSSIQSTLATTPGTESLMQESSKLKIRKVTLTNTSPPPGDEAELIDTSSTQSNPNTDNLNGSGVIVIKSFEKEESLAETSVAIKVGDEDSDSRPTGRRNSKESSFGKVSELISEEQKLAIETYYKVDMSVVDTEAVLKNLIVVDRKSIRCNICNLIYPRLDKCQVHVWGHLNMKPYKCTRCDFSTVTVSNVRCHIRKSHLKIKPFACHVCEKRYVTAVLLEEHLNTHTGARPFKCKLCDFASASRQVLSYHKTTHKPAKDINCNICGKEFFSRGRLRAHMFVHNKDKVVVCKLCSAYLSNDGALEMHHRKVHACDYVCNDCNKRFKSRKALHNHQNVHAAAKYKCSLCPNVYKSKHILKEHLLKHEGIRKYKCVVCEKSFAQQSHLAAHMAVHSEIRFHCPGCRRAFNRHDNMKVHTKRCKSFLANPELKELLIRREKSKSSNQRNSTNIAMSKVLDNPTSTTNIDEKETITNSVDDENLASENIVSACNIDQPCDVVTDEH